MIKASYAVSLFLATMAGYCTCTTFWSIERSVEHLLLGSLTWRILLSARSAPCECHFYCDKAIMEKSRFSALMITITIVLPISLFTLAKALFSFTMPNTSRSTSAHSQLLLHTIFSDSRLILRQPLTCTSSNHHIRGTFVTGNARKPLRQCLVYPIAQTNFRPGLACYIVTRMLMQMPLMDLRLSPRSARAPTVMMAIPP